MPPSIDLYDDNDYGNTTFSLTNESILRCYSDGEFDLDAYIKHKNEQLRADIDETEQILCSNHHKIFPDSIDSPPKKRTKRIIYARKTEDGDLVEIPPTDSLWYNLYVSCPLTNNKGFLNKFRRRFGMPYHKFVWLWEEAENDTWFPKWTDRKLLNGRRPSPLPLLILRSLCYFGRGFTFDDCEECTAF